MLDLRRKKYFQNPTTFTPYTHIHVQRISLCITMSFQFNHVGTNDLFELPTGINSPLLSEYIFFEQLWPLQYFTKLCQMYLNICTFLQFYIIMYKIFCIH